MLETAAQRKIISLLVEIKEEQQRQWAVLRELQARVQGQSCQEEEEVEALDIDLPLRTMEQLDETERHLEDAGAQRRMVGRQYRADCWVVGSSLAPIGALEMLHWWWQSQWSASCHQCSDCVSVWLEPAASAQISIRVQTSWQML